MPEPISCAEIADALAEVATGAATGPMRARVLSHVMTCESCRKELDELSRAADQVLLIAPEHEPPAGFESAVLDRIADELIAPSMSGRVPVPGAPLVSAHEGQADGSPAHGSGRPNDDANAGPVSPARSRRWVRPVLLAAVAAAIGLTGAGVVWQAGESDRELAAAYERTLDVANGQYFSAAPLTGADGEQVGHVFLYQGDPAWVFAVLDEDVAANSYEVVVTTRDGDVTVGTCVTGSGGCGAGGTVDADISAIARVTLVSPVDGIVATATLAGQWRQ